jgi:tetratricopeptide (TPR) repeat protein
MSRGIFCLVVLALLWVGQASATNGVECELSVYQVDGSTRDSNQVLLHLDTATFVQGIRATGFLVAFSVELEFTAIDSDQVSLNTHIATLAPSAQHYSRQYRAEYGLPARVEGILGKNNVRYAFTVRALRRVAVDTSACNAIHYRKDDFKFDPSANVDIYFVRQSVGDFYWNVVKGLMEERYRQFAELNKFNLPGKYLLYLCPCPIYSVIWDKRFGMMVDPTRNTAFAIYSIPHNAADPYLLMYAAMARHYGYAPQFLMEGFAGYLSLANFDMKEIVAQKRQLPLASLFSTRTYLSTDPVLADKMSASFVRYLIDQYHVDTFLRAYRAADDLNLLATIEHVYGKPLGQLEAEWLHYVDTVTVKPEQLGQYADQAEAMFDNGLALRLKTAQLARLKTDQDSIAVIGDLARLSFVLGKYEQASQWQEKLVKDDSSRYNLWLTLGGYQLMAGKNATAAESIQKAAALDTTHNAMITFSRGLSSLVSGDTTECRRLLTEMVTKWQEGMPYVEPRIMLLSLLMPSKNKDDEALAMKYSNEVLSALRQAGQGMNTSPTLYLWNGIAMLGKEDTGGANDQIISSIFLEPRPFYQGMGYLWLGKIADLRGERDVAKDYYRLVVSTSSAAYHQAEAKQWLERPYRQ